MLVPFLASLLIAAQPHSDAGVVRVPYMPSRERVVLPVTIGRSRPLRILLDSGMGYDGLLVYNPALRDSLALPHARRARIGGAGAGPGQSARTSESATFRVGTLTLRGQRVTVLEGDAFAGFPTDGVTGYSLLGHYRVGIDRARREVTLGPFGAPPPDSTWTALPLELKANGTPWVTLVASVEGRDSLALACYVDLASGESLELLTGPAQRFATPAGLEDVVLGRGLSGDVHGGRGRMAWVRLGPHRLDAVRAAFTPAAVRSKQAGADAVIGAGLLARFDVVFDYAAHALYVRPVAEMDAPR